MLAAVISSLARLSRGAIVHLNASEWLHKGRASAGNLGQRFCPLPRDSATVSELNRSFNPVPIFGRTDIEYNEDTRDHYE